MESPNPTFVFIPGAWHTPEYFQPLIDVLSSKPYSYPCVTVPLISVLSPKATTSITTMDPDIEVIRKAISAVVDRGNDVILVMHSYGGVPASESTKYFQKPEQGKGRILRLVYVCSFVLGVGGCLMDGIGGKDLPWWNIDRETNIVLPINPKEIFYNDISPSLANTFIAKILPFSYRMYYCKLTYSPIATIPSTYVICENDQAIPWQAQEGMIQAAKASVEEGEGKVVPFDVVERLDASHCCFMSKSKELVPMLVRAAGGRL